MISSKELGVSYVAGHCITYKPIEITHMQRPATYLGVVINIVRFLLFRDERDDVIAVLSLGIFDREIDTVVYLKT